MKTDKNVRKALAKLGDNSLLTTVIGSTGNQYEIRRFVSNASGSTSYSCTCPAYMYQRKGTCKHIEQAMREQPELFADTVEKGPSAKQVKRAKTRLDSHIDAIRANAQRDHPEVRKAREEYEKRMSEGHTYLVKRKNGKTFGFKVRNKRVVEIYSHWTPKWVMGMKERDVLKKLKEKGMKVLA